MAVSLEILFAAHRNSWSGSEQWLLAAARAMAARGHGVSVAAPAEAVVLRRARESGVPTLAVPFARDIDPPSAVRVLAHCLRRRVRAVCLVSERALRVAGPAARLARVPAVLIRRESESPLDPATEPRFHYERLVSGILVRSEAAAQALCSRVDWRPRGQVHVLYPCVDLRRFEDPRPLGEIRRAVRGPLGLTEDDLVLVHAGELSPRTNAALLVSLLPRLLEEAPRAHALIVGSGPAAPALRKLASDLGLADHVHLLGVRDDLPALLAASDVMVHCAHADELVDGVAEAGAAGLPVVAPAVGGMPEIVADGETGSLYSGDDPHDLVRAIRPYLNDPQLRRRHGQAARVRIRQRFALDGRMDELEAIFRQQLEH